jgi:hypothetical protein
VTLHILKQPVNPLALQILESTPAEESPVAVVLPPRGELPELRGVKIYRMTDPSFPDDGQSVSYSRLLEMIFTADKVVAW